MCFTGHRELALERPEIVAARLDRLLEHLYRLGYRRFFNGGAMGFDLLSAECVLALRKRHPDVQLLLAIPCATQTQHWDDANVARYTAVMAQADSIRVLSAHYYRGCMLVRNRYMVDRSSLCLCYLNQMKGGTMSTVAYASTQHLSILNTAMPDQVNLFIQKHPIDP